jgi:hypothetical protein
MQLFRNRKWRPFPVAIMLVATMAVVWHGAMSLLAHPLTSDSHAVVMADANSDASLDTSPAHEHLGTGGGLDKPHATHSHSKSKAGGECCSTVGAATLPMPFVPQTFVKLMGAIKPAPVTLGEGLAPAAPAKPPRTTYQC